MFSSCKGCCFSSTEAHAADQGSGLLERTVLPYPSRQQGTCTCSGRPLENHRQSPPALCHHTYISHPSRTRVGRREPPLVGVQKATEPAYPAAAHRSSGGTGKVLRGDKAEG